MRSRRIGTPEPVTSVSATGRPETDIMSASAVPDTTGPLPIDHVMSVASNRRPFVRLGGMKPIETACLHGIPHEGSHWDFKNADEVADDLSRPPALAQRHGVPGILRESVQRLD
jgi:hypothetical protein